MDDLIVRGAPAPSEEHDRLTAVINFYQQQFNSETIQADIRFSQILEVKEQCFYRRMKVGTEQADLMKCWVEEPGYVIIQHVKKTYNVNPEKHIKDADDNRVLKVNSKFPLKPGQPFITPIEALEDVAFSASEGIADVNVWVFPR